MGSRTVYFRECQCKRRSKLREVKIALPQRLAFLLTLSQTALMPQETPSVSLDADRYIARPETIKEAVVVGAWTKL